MNTNEAILTLAADEILNRIKIPRNQAGLMLLLMQHVVNGHRYWCHGTVSPTKLKKFVMRLANEYPITLDKVARSRQKALKRASVHFVVYPDGNVVHWYLLSTAGKGNIKEHCVLDEKVFDACSKTERLTWKQYQLYRCFKTWLKKTAKPDDKPAKVEDTTWSWRLLPSRERDHEAHFVATAKLHNRSQMEGHVKALAFMPMFAGIRTQVLRLFREAQKVWSKMNKTDPELNIPSLYYLRKVKIYDEPALTLLGLLEPPPTSTTSPPADEATPHTEPPTS